MSYTEICDKFETVSLHLQKGSDTLSSLNNYFRAYKKSFETFNSHLSKLVDTFQIELPKEGNMDTLSMALVSLNSHTKKFIQSNTNFLKNLQLDLIEPLELFSQNFNSTNQSQIMKAAFPYKELAKFKEQLLKVREKYFTSSETAEKAAQRFENLSKIDSDKDKREKAQRDAIYYRTQSVNACENYMQIVQEVNNKWDEYDHIIPTIMESLQQSEESRIHFIKSTLEKYAKHFQRYHHLCGENIEEMATIISNVNSSIDILVFVDSNKSKIGGLIREKFISYEEWKTNKTSTEVKEEDYEVLENHEINLDLEQINKVLDYLIPTHNNKGLKPTDDLLSFDEDVEKKFLEPMHYARLSSILARSEGRSLFCEILESKRKQSFLKPENLIKLSQFMKEALTVMIHDNDHNPVEFIQILLLSHVFHTEDEEKKRIYLANHIQHHIFSDKGRWIHAIEHTIAAKLEADREFIEKNSKQNKDSGILGALKQYAGKNPFQKDPEMERAEKSVAFTVISQFNYHMICIGVPIDIANSIVISLSKKYNLDPEKTTFLLSEIQVNQKSAMKSMYSSRDSVKIRQRDTKKWGDLLPIALSLKFLEPSNYFSILLVNKTWLNKFKKFVLKKWLLDWDVEPEKKSIIRTKIWIHMLQANSCPIEYSAFCAKVNENPEILGEHSEIIDMDVFRSYQSSSQITQDILRNLLRTYAFYNPDVGYCQGMNYIAGTLYIQLQNEEFAFKCMVGLIEKYDMSALYEHNLPKLKLFFYQLDRLIGLLLPEVWQMFKETGITSAHFSSPWFLTIFATILQNKPEILFPIWDLFILEGWKAIFKLAITILNIVSNTFDGESFDNIMTDISSAHLPRTEIQVFDEHFIERAKKVKISSELLEDLEVEYEKLKESARFKNKKK